MEITGKKKNKEEYTDLSESLNHIYCQCLVSNRQSE